MAHDYRLVLPVVLASIALGVSAQDPPILKIDQPPFFKEIGYDDMRLRLGNAMPDGKGVSIMQVEPSLTQVRPGKPPTNFPKLEGLFKPNQPQPTIKVLGNGKEEKVISGHSTKVAQLLYGKNSIATGLTDITLASPETQFVPGWLGFPTGKVKVGSDVPKISNHSYVEDQQSLTAVVRRMDDFIDKNDHIAVVAVGANTKGGPVAPLFGSSYNAIVVGLSNGECGNGLTLDNGDGPGRTKPDIVVPVTETSEATPIVAAACALLVESAMDMKDANAVHANVIKSCLLAGAEKQYDSLKLAGGWARDKKVEKSLHPMAGAGQLNIDQAHRILTSGSQVAGPDGLRKELSGWSYDSLASKAPHKTYYIDIPDEQQSIAITGSITWNRRFDENSGNPIVPIFELAFGRLDAKGDFERVIDISQSKFNNVEVVWSTAKLDPGRYGFRVRNTGEHESNYALAWTVKTKAAPGIYRPKVRTQSNTDLKWVYFALSVAIIVILIFLWKFRFLFVTVSRAPRRNANG